MNLSFLVLSWALTCGYIPSASTVIGNGQNHIGGVDNSKSMFQTIELGLTAWDTLTVWTNIETYDYMESVTTFAPFRSDYNIGLKAHRAVGAVVLESGIQHECIHPVRSGEAMGKWVAGGSTEIYVKVSGQIPLDR